MSLFNEARVLIPPRLFPSALLCVGAALTAMCHTEKAGAAAIYGENAGIKVDGRTSSIIQDGVCHEDESFVCLFFCFAELEILRGLNFHFHKSVFAAQ